MNAALKGGSGGQRRMHRPDERPWRAGFTLIELMVVLAIIGVLAAVVMPQLLNARRSATARAGQAHSSNVYKALYAALAVESTHTSDDILTQYGTSCMTATATSVRVGWKDAPEGTVLCNVATDGPQDFIVTLKMDGRGQDTEYVNGSPR